VTRIGFSRLSAAFGKQGVRLTKDTGCCESSGTLICRLTPLADIIVYGSVQPVRQLDEHSAIIIDKLYYRTKIQRQAPRLFLRLLLKKLGISGGIQVPG
jgi:hypothetical protein